MLRIILLTIAALFGVLALSGTPELSRQGTSMSASLFPRLAGSTPASMSADDYAWRDVMPSRPSPDQGAALASPAFSMVGAPAFYVSANQVMLREAPRPDALSVASLPRGRVVNVVGQMTGSWVAVRDTEGNIGFVASRFLSPNDPG